MAEQIVTTVVNSMTSFAEGVGTVIVNVFDDIFISGTGADQTLTNFGTYALVFLGIGMVTGVIGSIVYKLG